MKAKHIKKLKKKKSSPHYYRMRYERLQNFLVKWHNFYRFKCNKFFVSSDVAAYNKEIYAYNVARIKRKAYWYETRMSNTIIKRDLPSYV